MRVHRADILQDRGVLRERGGGTRTDLLQLPAYLASGGALVFKLARPVHRRGEILHQFVHLLVALGADIHLGAGGLGNGVHPRAALDQPHVEGRAGGAVEARLGEQRYRAAHRMERIAGTVIAPAMPAGTVKGHFETAAAERAGGDVVGVGAIHHHEGCYLAGQRRFLGQPPHPRQVALALLAGVGGQQQAASEFGPNRAGLPRAPDSQQRRQSGAVVGHARPVRRPSASTAISSFARGASTVSRCAVSAT